MNEAKILKVTITYADKYKAVLELQDVGNNYSQTQCASHAREKVHNKYILFIICLPSLHKNI